LTIIILDSIIKMNKRADKNIKTYRDYLEESASRGNREAINAIKELDSSFDVLSPYNKIINQNIKRKIWKPKEEVINEEMEINQTKIQDIKPYSKNAKKHPQKQIDQVANSIQRFGFAQPLVIDKNNEIIIGHCRLEASKKLGLTEVPTLKMENLSEEEVKALRLADNKLNESDWDMDLVIPELKGLDDDLLDLTGFSKDLLITAEERDDIIPQNAPQRAKRGDQWILGRNVVYCGDSTNPDDVKKLMGGAKARLLFTSPPYNMDAGMYETYEDNLKSAEYIDFNINTINVWKEYLFGFLFWNISYNKKSRWEFIEILYRIIKETGLKFLELIVWNKKHALPIMSKEMMTRQYEDILVVNNDDEAGLTKEIEMVGLLRNDKKAYFNRNTGKYLSNYWEIVVNNTQLDNHLACYPVALPTRAILIMTKENDIVTDPFLGSGSTLIACEKTNRICYGMELDPKYIDVIVQRYVDYTGNNKIKKNGEEIIWQK